MAEQVTKDDAGEPEEREPEVVGQRVSLHRRQCDSFSCAARPPPPDAPPIAYCSASAMFNRCPPSMAAWIGRNAAATIPNGLCTDCSSTYSPTATATSKPIINWSAAIPARNSPPRLRCCRQSMQHHPG